MNILQIPCNNFNPDSGKKTHIVIHGTAGGSSAKSIAQLFIASESGSNPVASHYIIDQSGAIVQCVQEKDGAWANGSVEWNNKAISIEHVKPAIDNSSVITQAQQDASFSLIKDIMARNPDIVYGNIIPHSAVYNTACPGPYPFDALKIFLGIKSITTYQRQQGIQEWTQLWVQSKLPSPPTGSAIFNSWLSWKSLGKNFGPPITYEYPNIDWLNNTIIQQDFAHASCEYRNGVSRWFDSRGEIT